MKAGGDEWSVACASDPVYRSTAACRTSSRTSAAVIRPSSKVLIVQEGELPGSRNDWKGGAAIGMKLAHPDKTIVCLTRDGSYMFSQPSTVHWIARRHQTPFLQVIYSNGGWCAPKFSALAIHPDGYASKAVDIDVSFDPAPDYSAALEAAFHAVRHKQRCAALDCPPYTSLKADSAGESLSAFIHIRGSALT